MKQFVLEKQYQGEWYYEGAYTVANIDALVQTAFWLGRNGSIYEGIRVTVREV